MGWSYLDPERNSIKPQSQNHSSSLPETLSFVYKKNSCRPLPGAVVLKLEHVPEPPDGPIKISTAEPGEYVLILQDPTEAASSLASLPSRPHLTPHFNVSVLCSCFTLALLVCLNGSSSLKPQPEVASS